MLNERGWVSYYIFKLRLYYLIDFFQSIVCISSTYIGVSGRNSNHLFFCLWNFQITLSMWFWIDSEICLYEEEKKSIEKKNPGSTTISLTTLENLKFLFTKFQKNSKKHYECCRLDHFRGHKSNRSIWTQNYLNIP